jgi:hypothetical protein
MEFYITGLKARKPMSTRKRRAFRGIRPVLATLGAWAPGDGKGSQMNVLIEGF